MACYLRKKIKISGMFSVRTKKYTCGKTKVVLKYFIVDLKCFKHMGTFPEGQHYLSAAGENRDIGPIWRGL